MKPIYFIFFAQLPQKKLAELTGALFWPAFHHPV
jgi:hypothetical protein